MKRYTNKITYIPAPHCLRGLNWYQIIAWTIHNFSVLLFTKHIKFTFVDIHKTSIKMVTSKKLRVSSNRDACTFASTSYVL